MNAMTGWFCAAAAAASFVSPAIAADDAAVEKFVREYEAAVNRHDAQAVSAVLNLSLLIERAQAGLVIEPDVARGFGDGLRAGLNWGESMTAGLGEHGHYKLLRTSRDENGPRALLRLVNGQGGLNYHDLVMREKPDGGLEIVDIYVYLSGELLSQTVRRSLLQVAAAVNQGNRVFLESVGLIRTMAGQAQAGQFAPALATYDRMPEPLQRDKIVMILRISCAGMLGDETLDEACTEFRTLFPDDPSVDLLTIDQLIAAEQWLDAITALERVRRAIGGDAYLEDLIANIHLRAGRMADAAKFARRAIEQEPTLDEGYWTLLEIALAERNHAATARMLTMLEHRFGWIIGDLGELAPYSEFVKSAVYREWNTGRRAAYVGE